MILVNTLILLAGFAALIKGADWFVDGSSALAKTFHVPGLIIGLTIVALGTSAPELAVSTLAAIQGSNEIAISNVVGSNIFNLLCVLGICALIHPVPVEKGITKRDFPVSIAVTLFVLAGTCFKVLFSGAAKVLKLIKQNGYQVNKIIKRGNGIININLSQAASNGDVRYENVTLTLKKNKVKLVKVYEQGTTFSLMYSYGGIYQLSAF